MGKTSDRWQCLVDRLASGAPCESLPMPGLEDDRLAVIRASDLACISAFTLSFVIGVSSAFLDEIQTLPSREVASQRLIDTENMGLFLSGSSARLVGREIATCMRGRALESSIYPFSLRCGK